MVGFLLDTSVCEWTAVHSFIRAKFVDGFLLANFGRAGVQKNVKSTNLVPTNSGYYCTSLPVLHHPLRFPDHFHFMTIIPVFPFSSDPSYL